ncbi:MAG TPA: TldD/PmbA family protein [Candidatus Limnocylindria bacterium]|nr:TldD/PmbA family protein [Candidatus Limnocylindria bacterium]
MADSPAALTGRDAATAAELRERYGYLQEVVADMERRVPYASAMVRSREGLRLSLRDAEQAVVRQDPQEGVVLTASDGHRLQEASSDRTDAETVRQLASDLVDSLTGRTPEPGDPSFDIAVDGAALGDFATPVVDDPARISLRDKIARYEGVRQRLREMDERAVQAVSSYTEIDQRQVFANRAGLSTQQVRRTTLAMLLFVSDGSRQEYVYLAKAGTGGLEKTDVTEEELREAATTAGELLHAETMPPGMYDVVTDSVTTGTIAHEAFGHGMETDMFLKQRARGAEFIGKRVGSDLVNIVDDPTLPGAYGSYFVDDEGQPSTPTQIIRDGILQGGLTDLYSAVRLGLQRTANGRRESVQRKAYARMSNTFFQPGSSTPAEVLASLDDGVYLCQTENGMEDPKGWGIQIWAHFAREYKAGKPTGRIFSPVAITGYVPDVLRDVSMVANDFETQAGTCGKGWKELVPVGSGGPHIRTRCRLA